jgi:hypothetical protein
LTCANTTRMRPSVTPHVNTEDVEQPEMTFVDDLAFPFSACDPDELNIKAARIHEIAANVLRSYGFELNYTPGKTQFVLSYVGPGAKAARAAQFACDTPHILVNCDAGDIKVPVGDSYVHLGTQFNRTGLMTPEFRMRAQAFKRTVRDNTKTLAKAAYMTLKDQQLLLQLLLLSKALFKCQVWSGFSDAQLSVLRTPFYQAVLKLQGRSRANETGRVSHEYLASQEGYADISVYIRKARLLYFARVVRHGPPILLALIQQTSQYAGSWGAQLCGDLNWLKERSTKLDSLPVPATGSFAQWQALARDYPNQWKKIVQNTVSDVELNVQPGSTDTFDVPLAYLQHECSACDLSFSSPQGLCLHSFKVHGRRSIAARYTMPGGTCQECLLHCHDRPRLARHLIDGHKLRGLSSCLGAMIFRDVQPLSDDQLCDYDACDADAARKQRAGAYGVRQPSVRAYGPFLKPLTLDF